MLDLLKFGYIRLTNRVLFPQVNAHSNARGQTVVKSSPAQMSSRVTTARTPARSASTAPCVTSASWGATTWRNMPADTQASIPACSRAPVWPRGAAAPCPCLPLTLETRVLQGCDTPTPCCADKRIIQLHTLAPEVARPQAVFAFPKITHQPSNHYLNAPLLGKTCPTVNGNSFEPESNFLFRFLRWLIDIYSGISDSF